MFASFASHGSNLHVGLFGGVLTSPISEAAECGKLRDMIHHTHQLQAPKTLPCFGSGPASRRGSARQRAWAQLWLCGDLPQFVFIAGSAGVNGDCVDGDCIDGDCRDFVSGV